MAPVNILWVVLAQQVNTGGGDNGVTEHRRFPYRLTQVILVQLHEDDSR